MTNYLYAATVALALTASATAAATTTNFARERGEKASQWADSVYATLTERQRVAQLVFPKVVPKDNETTKATLKRYIATDGCGGLLFTEGTLAQHVAVTQYAQSVAKVPVMITFDGEWGLSMRISDSPRFPHNMALGAISDYKLLYEYGKEMAKECRLAGVHVNFAPDADVNSNPANPVIGYRAFGEDPERVAKASAAYSLGLEDGKVQAVAKHFPGHGDTDTDSHKANTVVNHNRARLDTTDLVPFKEFIDAGCSGIMVGHIAVPALDPSGTPASLSEVITSKLLRKDMGFEGLVFTDALGMKGATNFSSNPSINALKAGADVLLCPTKPEAAIDGIMAAIADGKISKDIVEDRCKRVLRYKYLLDCAEGPAGTGAQISKEVNNPEAEALIKKLAEKSITVLRNNSGILPLGASTDGGIAVVNLGMQADNDFVEVCRHYAPVKSYFTINETFSQASINKITASGTVVAVVYDDKAATREAFSQLAASSRNFVAVFLVNPYKMKKFASSLGKASAIVLAYDNIPAERISAAEAIFGGIATSGKMPVALAGLAKLGEGIELPKIRLGFSTPAAEGMEAWLTDSINTFVNECLKAGAFPGCQVLVAKNGNIVFNESYGRLSTAPGSAKVDNSTIYDLASVSKAVGTLPGIMKAYDTGLLKLDDRLGKLIPEITDTAKTELTVRELLYHQTGIQPSLNVFGIMFDTLTYTGKLLVSKPDANHHIKIQKKLYGHDKARLRTDIIATQASDRYPIEASKGIFTGKVTYDTLMQRIYNSPVRSNKNYLYSCLNFCLLMDIEQRLTGRSHDEFVRTEIFEPLGAYRTGYRPLTWTSADNIAPTENDTYLRRQTLHGYVHDELANLSGGVQGNAGLFANASDIAKYCQMLLNRGSYGGKQILSPETAELFITDKSPSCRRGLGFDKPDKENPDYSPTCDEANAEVIGHTGFTGTIFWIDPTEDLIFVFLTNRVNPTRDSVVFNRMNIRPHLFSLVNRAIK